jgi:hypothetical protein
MTESDETIRQIEVANVIQSMCLFYRAGDWPGFWRAARLLERLQGRESFTKSPPDLR